MSFLRSTFIPVSRLRSSPHSSSSFILSQRHRPLLATPPSSAPFSSTLTPAKDPSENRRNSEGTIPGSGSTEEIADSEGAFSPEQTRPEESGKKISREKPEVDMSTSAASSENAKRTASGGGNQETTSSEKGTNPPASREDLGGSRARKGK